MGAESPLRAGLIKWSNYVPTTLAGSKINTIESRQDRVKLRCWKSTAIDKKIPREFPELCRCANSWPQVRTPADLVRRIHIYNWDWCTPAVCATRIPRCRIQSARAHDGPDSRAGDALVMTAKSTHGHVAAHEIRRISRCCFLGVCKKPEALTSERCRQRCDGGIDTPPHDYMIREIGFGAMRRCKYARKIRSPVSGKPAIMAKAA